MRNWKWWLLWIAFFLLIELPAIFNDRSGDTLSEAVWSITAIPFFWWMFAGFLGWLLVHLLGPQVRRWLKSWKR